MRKIDIKMPFFTLRRMLTRRGTSPLSMTAWICDEFPAVMLDKAHAASYRQYNIKYNQYILQIIG